MNAVKFRIVALLLFCYTFVMNAQWESPYSNFWTVKNYFNPSFTSTSDDEIEVAGIYKYQWTGLKNSPKHYFLSASMPFDFWGLKHSAGIVSSNMSVGDNRNTLFAAQYRYILEIGKGTLNLGLQAGMQELNFDSSSIRFLADTLQPNNHTITANPVSKKVLDLNAGISWNTKNFFAGAGIMHLTQPRFYVLNNPDIPDEIVNDSTRSKIPISYNFMGGCNITLSHTLFEIQPMMFVQTNLSEYYLQTALQIIYNKKYSTGASIRGKEGYSFFAGTVFEEFHINYSYDWHTSGMGKKSKGSHELCISYHFPSSSAKRKPQPHKSIRLL